MIGHSNETTTSPSWHDAPPGYEINVCSGVSYSHRVFDPATWNWCIVPNSSFDAIFFACIAVIVSCSAPPKWNTLISLVAGGVYQVFANYFNLGHVSNASALWLGITPAEVFVYIFLPPLILDSACRMDFFLLKRVGWNVIFMAFIMVLGAALLLIPFMLYALGMASRGWDAVYVALFGTMIGSTDAASVIAILKSGGAPELLSIILEGESLFNDASSLTMFDIFSEVIIHEQNLARDIGAIAWKTVTSFLGGFAIGSTTALFMALMVKWLQLRDMKGYIETALSLALAYIAYYITQIWVECSGVIAVVIFGLWGSATVQWGMNSKNLSKGLFLGFYDVFVCILNGIIFFFVGASIINLVIRSQNFLQLDGNETTSQFYAGLAWRFAAIYAYSFTCRFAFTWFSFSFFRFFNLSEGGNLKQTLFVTLAGLRGSLSLILVQSIIQSASETDSEEDPEKARVQAEMALLTALYVLATLVINAPILGPLMTLLGLNTISKEQLHMQKRIHKLLKKHSETSLDELRANPHELMQGVSWDEVQSAVHHWHKQGHNYLATEEKRSLRADFMTGWRGFLSYFCIDLNRVEKTEMCSAKKGAEKKGWWLFGGFMNRKGTQDPAAAAAAPGVTANVNKSSFSQAGKMRTARNSAEHPPSFTTVVLASDDKADTTMGQNGAELTDHPLASHEEVQRNASVSVLHAPHREISAAELDDEDQMEKDLEAYMAFAANDVCLFAPSNSDLSSGDETLQADVPPHEPDVENPDKPPAPVSVENAEQGDAQSTETIVVSVIPEPAFASQHMNGDMATLHEEPEDEDEGEGEGHKGHEGFRAEGEGEGEDMSLRGDRPPPLDLDDLGPQRIKSRPNNYRVKSSVVELFKLPSFRKPTGLETSGSFKATDGIPSPHDPSTEGLDATAPALNLAAPDGVVQDPLSSSQAAGEETSQDYPNVLKASSVPIPLTTPKISSSARDQDLSSPPMSPSSDAPDPSSNVGGAVGASSFPRAFPSLPAFPAVNSSNSLTGLESSPPSNTTTSASHSTKLRKKSQAVNQRLAFQGIGALATDSEGKVWQNPHATFRAPQPSSKPKYARSLSTASVPLMAQSQGQGRAYPMGSGMRQKDLMRYTFLKKSNARLSHQGSSTSSLTSLKAPLSGGSELKELEPSAHLNHIKHEQEISAALEEEEEEEVDEDESQTSTVGRDLHPEYRLRVLVGLRQHFRQRKHEGMIGFRSFNVLDSCCKEELHERLHTPLSLWAAIETQISKRWYLRWSGAMVFQLRKAMLKVNASTHKGWWKSFKLWMLGTPASILSSFLAQMNKIAMEASVELWMGLTDSDHIQWLEYSGPAGKKLLEEVKCEAEKVWEFIVDRRIESPEGFNAIQTYRCTLALLTQQQMFIDELAEDGVLEESEVEKLSHAVLRQRQRVERKGSTAQGAPTILSILSNTDLFRGIPESTIKKVRSQGRLRAYKRGDKIWDGAAMKRGEPVDLMLVVFGLIRVVVDDGMGGERCYYMGSGGAYGLIPNICGAYIPGVVPKAVYAEGNAMGRGPVMLVAPYSALTSLGSAINLAVFEAKLICKACVQVCEQMKSRTLASLARHIQLLLIEIVDDYHFYEEAAGSVDGRAGGGGGLMMRDSNDASPSALPPAQPMFVQITPTEVRSSPRPSEDFGPFTIASRGSQGEGLRGGGQANAAARLHLSVTKINSLLNLSSSDLTSLSSSSSSSSSHGRRGGLSSTLLSLDQEVALHLIDPEAEVDTLARAEVDTLTRQELEDMAHMDSELKELLARSIGSRARSVYDEIQTRLAKGELFTLAPGARYIQERTCMLIQGSLHLPSEGWEGGEGGVSGGEGGLGEVQHDAPSLLFWSPDFFDHAVTGQMQPGPAAPSTTGQGPSAINGQEGGHVLVAGIHGAKLIIA